MKTILAANWKMNQSIAEIQSFFKEAGKKWGELFEKGATEVVVGCPAIYIPAASKLANEHTPGLKIASQNTCGESSGAFTGEVSYSMLQEFSVDTSIIGHSERRHVFGESDALVASRATGLLAQGSEVIFCIGETLEQRKSEATQEVLREQLLWLKTFENLDLLSKLTIAYEPVWAIGTGETATPELAGETHQWIQQILAEFLYERKCVPIPIVYGGSVKPANFAELLKEDEISGALVGGASLKAGSFLQLLEIAAKKS